MELIIAGERITSDELVYVDEGNEGEVYRYKNMAVKLYKRDSCKPHLSLDDTMRMTKIATEYVLLPRGVVFDGSFKQLGYYTSFKEKLPEHLVVELSPGTFADKLDEVYGDLKLLSKNGVLIYDLGLVNFIYDGHFRLVDPGLDEFVDFPEEVVYLANKEEFADFVVNGIIKALVPVRGKKNIKKLCQHFSESYISDIFRYEGTTDETVKQYVKRIIKDE